MGKYFGTDGFRGEANCSLTADHAFRVGRFLGWYYTQLKRRSGSDGPARIVIGKDTRRSSYMFEYSLVGGLVAGFSIGMVLRNLIPIVLIAVLIALGLWKAERAVVKGFGYFGKGHNHG